MEVIKQPGMNVIYAEDQDEYLSLPSHKDSNGTVTTCWALSWKEKLKILFTGKIYLQILTFNKPLQPLKMSVDNLIPFLSERER